MRPNHLPIHIKFEASKRIGREGKGIFILCLIVVLLSVVSGSRLDQSTLLFLVVAAVVGLGIWASKLSFYRGQKIEILVDANSISFSRILLKHPNIWPQFIDGHFVRIPWVEIAKWDSSEPNEYTLRIRSKPSLVMTLDREPLLEIENQFIPHVRHFVYGEKV